MNDYRRALKIKEETERIGGLRIPSHRLDLRECVVDLDSDPIDAIELLEAPVAQPFLLGFSV